MPCTRTYKVPLRVPLRAPLTTPSKGSFKGSYKGSYIVNPRKLEHRFRMIHAGIPFSLL